MKNKSYKKSKDSSFNWITKEYGMEWEDWRYFFSHSDVGFNAKSDLASFFFKNYLLVYAPYAYNIEDFLKGKNGHKCNEKEFKELSKNKCKETTLNKHFNTIKSIVYYIINSKFSEEGMNKTLIPIYFNPFDYNHKYADPSFRWIVQDHGDKWENWRKYIEEFCNTNNASIIHYSRRITYKRIKFIFEKYILEKVPYAYNIEDFFLGKNDHKCSSQEIDTTFKDFDKSYNSDIVKSKTILIQLVNWIIDTYYSEISEDGLKIPNYINPLSRFAQIDKNEDFIWIIRKYGRKWNLWRILIAKWFKTIKQKDKKRVKGEINIFTEHYLLKLNRDICDVESYFKYSNSQKIELKKYDKIISDLGYSKKTKYTKLTIGRQLLTWIIENNYYTIKENGYKQLLYPNPLITKFDYSRTVQDKSFLWIDGILGNNWIEWRKYVSEYYNFRIEELSKKNNNIINDEEKLANFRCAISIFFLDYLSKYPDNSNIKFLFEHNKSNKTSVIEYEQVCEDKGFTKATSKNYRFEIKKLVNWILKNHFWEIKNGRKVFLYRNPFIVLGNKYDDLNLYFLTDNYGNKWEDWRILASEWLKNSEKALDARISAVYFLFEKYLIPYAQYTHDISSLFTGNETHKPSTKEIEEIMKNSEYENSTIEGTIRYITIFTNWVLEKKFIEKDELGNQVFRYKNPFHYIQVKNKLMETVRTPLPYALIKECREIVSGYSSDSIDKKTWEEKTFKNWSFAQKSFTIDWINVSKDFINKDDPDCVWRKRTTKTAGIFYEIWSPIRAMALFIKLHLPLRTYQIRFLDSGESDTWRYSNGKWQLNTKHEFAIGNERRPYEKGVFKKIYDPMIEYTSTGMYINTNKTADQNKDENNKGYIIPWEHEELLYWLEKLRNWQEKYNPITKPTKCTSLSIGAIGSKKSKNQLKKMGEICFLFRNPIAKKINDFDEPISTKAVEILWYKTLQYLEKKLQNNYPEKRDRIKLIEENSDTKTLFPLHSLRVSLITAYAMNTNLPLPVISKLLAGHSRILMTIYYNKITPSVMKRKMNEAEINLLNKSDETLQDFLLDQSLINSSCDISEVSITYNNANAVENSLKNINPLGISEVTLGLCLSGRNTSLSNNDSSISGCWNGGEFISEKNGTRIHGPVPNGSENCVRCRWFITDATKLPELTRHFNMIGYKTHIVANQASELNNQIEQLKDKKYECEINDIPFTEESTLAILQRRYEKQIVEADELTKDWISTYRLINKIISIEKNRLKKDTKDKLIAVGKIEDLIPKIKFIDVKSELSHLSILCDEAEYFPEIYDEIRKTHAIEKRTIHLSKIFLKINKPIFMELDEDQQFIIGNAIMRRMAKLTGLKDKFESFEVVGNYLETGKYLSDKNLLDQALKELSFEKILLPFQGETK